MITASRSPSANLWVKNRFKRAVIKARHLKARTGRSSPKMRFWREHRFVLVLVQIVVATSDMCACPSVTCARHAALVWQWCEENVNVALSVARPPARRRFGNPNPFRRIAIGALRWVWPTTALKTTCDLAVMSPRRSPSALAFAPRQTRVAISTGASMTASDIAPTTCASSSSRSARVAPSTARASTSSRTSPSAPKIPSHCGSSRPSLVGCTQSVSQSVISRSRPSRPALTPPPARSPAPPLPV